MNNDDKKLIGRYLGSLAWETAKSMGRGKMAAIQYKQQVYSQNIKRKVIQIIVMIILVIAIIVFIILRLRGVYNGIL